MTDRAGVEALVARLEVSRAKLFTAIRPLRGAAYAAAREPLQAVADAEAFVNYVLSRVYNIEIWGAAPADVPTPEEASSALIDARETLHHVLAPTIDAHLDQEIRFSDGGTFTIRGGLEGVLEREAAALRAASGG